MRDPVMYRILHAKHHRTGDEWCIYPMYDYAHGQSDSIENITHSMCTLEFADHQPLYRWYIEELGIFPSQQIEFDRLNLTYTLLSKRKLLQLVKEKHVTGWDDPRMPTLSGIRRRGFTPEAIRTFCDRIGVIAHQRHHRYRNAGALPARRPEPPGLARHGGSASAEGGHRQLPRRPDEEFVEVANNPEDPSRRDAPGSFLARALHRAGRLPRSPPPKYYRLSPGKEVRLRNAYFITAQSVVKDAAGNVVEVHCTYDPASRGGNSPDGRKVKSTIHWVSAEHAIYAEIRLYDKLFTKPIPSDVEEGETFLDILNPNSLEVLTERSWSHRWLTRTRGPFQFERVGYFCLDPDSTPGKPVFNRTLR